MDRINILGVQVDMVTIPEAADIIVVFLSEDKLHTVYTPNSEIIMEAYRDKAFSKVLNEADLLTADGIGVVYAAKILKNPIKERCAGFDVACRVLEKCAKSGDTVYFFGSKPGVADKAKEVVEERYPGLKVVGTSDGYFDEEKEKQIVADINEKKPNVLFVCLGAPKQEKWIYNHKDVLNVNVCMGVGGTVDVLAGTAERAPEFYINHNIEWLYRLIKQPSRIGRMMDLPKFGFSVLLHGRKFK